MLSFAHLAQNWHSIHKRDESGVLKTVRHRLERFESEIYHGWMKVLKAKLMKIVNPGGRFLACQPGESGHRSFLYQAFQFDIDDFLGMLDRIYYALRRYLIEESIITRVINELLKFVGEMAFNDLLRKTHSPRVLVDGLSENIRRIEVWCKIRAMSGSILQLAHLTVHMFFCHL